MSKSERFHEGNCFTRHGIHADLLSGTEPDCLDRMYITPKRIVWQTPGAEASVENADVLLEKRDGQVTLPTARVCTLKSRGGTPGILLDFGVELHGGLEISIPSCGRENRNPKIRVRFGESAMEAMSDIGYKNATNHHAMRDYVLNATTMGCMYLGNTGFRFVRIDLLDDNSLMQLKSVRAIMVYRELEYKGSFRCNDELLNNIWKTAAYTVHLNMQEYIWDGIKRDRVVWIGDIHPEISTIQAVFGNHPVVNKSLDLVRDTYSLPKWMNGISSYSIWWILVHYDWFMHNGDLKYLSEQKEYMLNLLEQLSNYIGENDEEKLTGMRFIDWPSVENVTATHAGLHSLMTLGFDAGAVMCEALGEKETAGKCRQTAARLRTHIPEHNGSKQAAALMALAQLADAGDINKDVLAVDGSHRMSTFMGYYILKARGMAGDIQGCLESLREYWGGMLKLGATTFWEDFNLDWVPNACRIDELTADGQKDIHGDFGAHCYIGYRHSLCHGWSSGPVPWLAEYVLGIKIAEPGCRKIKVEPNLGDLEWAEGTFPTPYGIIRVKHVKDSKGGIQTTINAPDGVEIM